MNQDSFGQGAQVGIVTVLYEKGYYLNRDFFFYEGRFFAPPHVTEALGDAIAELFIKYPPSPDDLED